MVNRQHVMDGSPVFRASKFRKRLILGLCKSSLHVCRKITQVAEANHVHRELLGPQLPKPKP